MVTKIGKFHQKVGYIAQLVYEVLSRFLRQVGVFVNCRFNCVSESCVKPIHVAMVTKMWKFQHKNHNNSARISDISRILHLCGVFGVSQSNGVIQIFARPTFVAMVTKIGKFHQKVGYSSACV